MKHLLTFITLVLSLLVISACGDGSNDNSDLCANYLYYIDGKCTCLNGKNQLGEVCTNPFDKPPVTDGDDATTDGDNTTTDGDAVGGDAVDGDAVDGDAVDGDAVDGDVTPSYELIWISILGDSFEMGCSPKDNSCEPQESDSNGSQHTVDVSDFDMTPTEVTNKQYAKFMNINGNICNGEICVEFNDPDLQISKSNGLWSADAGYEDYPIVEVTWFGAKVFCQSHGGRLPSEAKWEFAARAETTTKYHCGDNIDCLDGIAWYDKNSYEETHPVGQKTDNDFELYDMLGNVYEWVADCPNGSNYDNAPSTGIVWSGGNCSVRIVRGGSWGGNSSDLRVSNRGILAPDFTGNDLGFRCVRDPQ